MRNFGNRRKDPAKFTSEARVTGPANCTSLCIMQCERRVFGRQSVDIQEANRGKRLAKRNPENSGATTSMKDHTYKLIELVGTSTMGIEDAVQHAVERAGRTIKNMRWFQVVETRGEIDQNKVAHWQVTIKIGFTIEDPSEGTQAK